MSTLLDYWKTAAPDLNWWLRGRRIFHPTSYCAAFYYEVDDRRVFVVNRDWYLSLDKSIFKDAQVVVMASAEFATVDNMFEQIDGFVMRGFSELTGALCNVMDKGVEVMIKNLMPLTQGMRAALSMPIPWKSAEALIATVRILGKLLAPYTVVAVFESGESNDLIKPSDLKGSIYRVSSPYRDATTAVFLLTDSDDAVTLKLQYKNGQIYNII